MAKYVERLDMGRDDDWRKRRSYFQIILRQWVMPFVIIVLVVYLILQWTE